MRAVVAIPLTPCGQALITLPSRSQTALCSARGQPTPASSGWPIPWCGTGSLVLCVFRGPRRDPDRIVAYDHTAPPCCVPLIGQASTAPRFCRALRLLRGPGARSGRSARGPGLSWPGCYPPRVGREYVERGLPVPVAGSGGEGLIGDNPPPCGW